MAINKPYKRTYRPFVDGTYNKNGNWEYVTDPRFAKSPEHYVRAYLLILKDLLDLLDYIEPADINGTCYSYRIHALLIRTCIEVEANCKAILTENNYIKLNSNGQPIDMNMKDYKKINNTHLLSSYKVKIPYWSGNNDVRAPFMAWSSGNSPSWYQAYNITKHDRQSEFINASFDCLLDACCGLLVVLSAQFGTWDFSPGNISLSLDCPDNGMEYGIGGYFHIKFPDPHDWSQNVLYDFNWENLKSETEPFQTINYS
jgi:hypothetical protein